MTPRRTNGPPTLAVSDTMRMSQCSGYVRPMPTAWPLMAAMTGLHMSCGAIPVALSPDWLLPRRGDVTAGKVGAHAERVARAGEDHHPNRVVVVARRHGVRASSASSRTVHALRFCGRFSVTVAMGPSTRRRISAKCSAAMSHHRSALS